MNILQRLMVDTVLARKYRVSATQRTLSSIRLHLSGIAEELRSMRPLVWHLYRTWIYRKSPWKLKHSIYQLLDGRAIGERILIAQGLHRAQIRSVEELLGFTKEEVLRRCGWTELPEGLAVSMRRYGLKFVGLTSKKTDTH
jgi:hypothetical protein